MLLLNVDRRDIDLIGISNLIPRSYHVCRKVLLLCSFALCFSASVHILDEWSHYVHILAIQEKVLKKHLLLY